MSNRMPETQSAPYSMEPELPAQSAFERLETIEDPTPHNSPHNVDRCEHSALLLRAADPTERQSKFRQAFSQLTTHYAAQHTNQHGPDRVPPSAALRLEEHLENDPGGWGAPRASAAFPASWRLRV